MRKQPERESVGVVVWISVADIVLRLIEIALHFYP